MSKKLSKNQAKKLRASFKQFDETGDGSLNRGEVKQLLEQCEIEAPNFADKFNEFDENGDGKVSFPEFMAFFSDGPPKSTKPKPTIEGDKFTDEEFPPNDASVFESSNPAVDGVAALHQYAGQPVVWKRASELPKRGGAAKLFDSVHPNDIAQGQLGDCWLMAALAGIAEFDGSIYNLFEEKSAAANCQYTVNIYDPVKRNWEKVTIDDWVPLAKNHKDPLCAKPQDNEMWVLLVEKAMAKWFGSYAKMQAAYCMLAYSLLLECPRPCRVFTQSIKFSAPFDTENYQGLTSQIKDAHDRNSVALGMGSKATADKLWLDLKTSDTKNHVMSCWTYKDPDTSAGKGASGEHIGANGIVKGHAYSLISVKEVSADGNDWKCVQVRNPWGANPAAEWKGDLSDNWSQWSKYKELKDALEIDGKCDGMFWMNWDDFRSCFSDVGIVPVEMSVPKLGTVENKSSYSKSKRTIERAPAVAEAPPVMAPPPPLAPTEMKVTSKKGTGFYIKSAKSFFTGFEDKDGHKKEAVDALDISGLGDAVNTAVAVATAVEDDKLAKITKVETTYPEMKSQGGTAKGCARIQISMEKC